MVGGGGDEESSGLARLGIDGTTKSQHNDRELSTIDGAVTTKSEETDRVEMMTRLDRMQESIKQARAAPPRKHDAAEPY